MSSLVTSPTVLSDHRVRLVTDAVVSAYLSEISRPPRPRRIPSPAPRPRRLSSRLRGTSERMHAQCAS